MVVYIYRMNVKDKYYIGSTKNIHKRKWEHNYDCYHQNRKHYNYKVYKYIRDNCNDWSEVSFQILDVYDDINNEFKREIEDYYIKYFSNNLNSIGAKFDKEKSDKKFYKKRNEERRVKVQCECGRIVNFGSLGGHRKTKIHQELLNK